MDYGAIVERAFKLTWKHKYLWLLGILVGLGSGGGGPNFSFPGGDFSGSNREFNPDIGAVGDWFSSHIALIVGIVLFLIALLIVFFLLSSWATAALIAEVKDIEMEDESSTAVRRFGAAFAKGRPAFWRIVGLRLLVFLIGLGYVLLLGLAIGGLVAAIALKPAGAVLIAILAGVVLAITIIAALPFFVALGLSVQFANRYVVLMNERVVASLKSGFGLLRGTLGPSLVVWLMAVGLGIGSAIALVFGMIIVIIPLAIIVALSFVPGPVFGVVMLVPVVLVFLAVVLTASGALGAFFSTYWTLAFMRLAENVSPRDYI